MEIAVKVGDKRHLPDPDYIRGWRDGQIIEAREDGFPWGNATRRHHCIIRTQHDFWKERGGRDWKVWTPKAREFKKLFNPVDSVGKYSWEYDHLQKSPIRLRDRFFDFLWMLEQGLINETQYKNIYDRSIDPGLIYIDRDLDTYLFHEDIHQRTEIIKNQGLVEGLVCITTDAAIIADPGSYGYDDTYATPATFEADIGATLTDDLTGEHDDEETAITAGIIFDFDTATYQFTMTARPGCEHDGHTINSGARIAYQNSDNFRFNNVDLENGEISKLILICNGINDTGVVCDTGARSGGLLLVDRCLCVGDVRSWSLVRLDPGAWNVRITNNIVYDMGDDLEIDEGGVICNGLYATNTWYIANNTIIDCSNGIRDMSSDTDPLITLKNNLVQGSRTADYATFGNDWEVTGHNISEDDTGPDEDYDNTDVHTNSIFVDYGANNFLLDPEGDSTNLAIVDDGEDLSGTFTDDIIGQTRSTWYIGASEIVAGGEAHTLTVGNSSDLLYSTSSALKQGHVMLLNQSTNSLHSIAMALQSQLFLTAQNTEYDIHSSSPSLILEYLLSLDNSVLLGYSTSIDLISQLLLNVSKSVSAKYATGIDLPVGHLLNANNSRHLMASTSLILSMQAIINALDSKHDVYSSDTGILPSQIIIDAQNTAHQLYSALVNLLSYSIVSVNNSVQNLHSTDAGLLSQVLLNANNALHDLNSLQATLLAGTSLTTQHSKCDSYSAQTTLIAQSILQLQKSVSQLYSTLITFVDIIVLTMQDSTMTMNSLLATLRQHTLMNPSMTMQEMFSREPTLKYDALINTDMTVLDLYSTNVIWGIILALQNSVLSSLSAEPTLKADYILDVNNAVHDQLSEVVTLLVDHKLTVNNAYYQISSTVGSFVEIIVLALQNSAMGLTSTDPSIKAGAILSIQNTLMDVLSTMTTLTANQTMAVNPSLQGLYSNITTISAATVLLVMDVLCRFYGGQVTLTTGELAALYTFLAKNMTNVFSTKEMDTVFSLLDKSTIFPINKSEDN